MSEVAGARASRPHRGWHERGYLPHFDGGAVVQTVIFRLADSLPRAVFEKIAASSLDMVGRWSRMEDVIDLGRGACLLGTPENALIVRDALFHFDEERYRLLKWVVMPNHVHAMIEQHEGFQLERIIHSWKSFTSKAINKRENRNGILWAPDYFDRFVRDEGHYRDAAYYIENNPVKAKLVPIAERWPYSSASGETFRCGRDARAPAKSETALE